MRKILIVVVVLVLVLAGVVVLAVMNVNSLLEENRGELARLASEAAGRDVRFDKAVVAFPGRLSIEVRGLRVSEDPRFGKNDFLALETAYVSVEIWPALQRRIEISGIRLDRPTIRIIQTEKGFNFDSLGASKKPTEPGPAPEEKAASPIALAVAGFQIVDATILYEDRTAKPPVALTIEEFDSSGTDILGAAAGQPIEIHFGGLARPTLAKPGSAEALLASRLEGSLHVTDLEAGALDLQLVSPSLHPALLGFHFEEGGAVEHLDDFDLKVSVPANAAAIGYPIQLASSGGHLAGFDYALLDTKLLYRGSKVDIEKLGLGIAGGHVDLLGNLSFGPLNKSPFALDTKLTDLGIDPLAVILLGTQPGLLSGRISGDVDLKGDSLDWAALERSLAGQIDLAVDGATLEQFNVLDRVVQRLLADPGFGPLVGNAIRDVAPEALSAKRTKFEDTKLDLSIAKGRITADALELATGDFDLRAAGSMGLDGTVDGSGKIRLSKDLSGRILKKADAAAPLLGGEEGIVELPIFVGGTTTAMTFKPDVAALAERARANATDEALQGAAKKLTDVLLGKKKKSTEGQPETQADRDRAATEDLLNQGLNSLLKKKK